MSDALAAMELRAETAEIMLADVRGECERLAAEVEDLRKQLEELKGGALSSDPSDLVSEMMRVAFLDGDKWSADELAKMDKRVRFDIMYGAVPLRKLPSPTATWKVTIEQDLSFMRYRIRAQHRHDPDKEWNMIIDDREALSSEAHRHIASKFADVMSRNCGLMSRERDYLCDIVRYELGRLTERKGRP